MHIRPLGFFGPKVKDFKKSGVRFEVHEPPERLQGSILTMVKLDRKLLRRSGQLLVYRQDASGLFSINGLNIDDPHNPLARPETFTMPYRKTLTGRIRYIDPRTNKEHKLRILG
jgi:hypothetical protein